MAPIVGEQTMVHERQAKKSPIAGAFGVIR
jgi:hypothetical protein